MTINVKVGEAKTHLSSLLTKVEAGEEVIISRGDEQIARLVKIDRRKHIHKVIENIRAARKLNGRTTAEEILAWRDEGRK